MKEQRISIYQRASVWGIPFGLYLTCIGVSAVFVDWFMPLSYLFFILLVSTPLVVYYFQRRMFIEEDGFSEFSALWMLGIMLFMFGTVLASFLMFLVIQFGRPDFLYDQALSMIKSSSEVPEMRDSEFVKVLQRMVDDRLLPAPIEMVFNTFWFITSAGCIMSAITAAIARRRLPHRP